MADRHADQNVLPTDEQMTTGADTKQKIRRASTAIWSCGKGKGVSVTFRAASKACWPSPRFLNRRDTYHVCTCVCVCVCARARARVRVCVRGWVRVSRYHWRVDDRFSPISLRQQVCDPPLDQKSPVFAAEQQLHLVIAHPANDAKLERRIVQTALVFAHEVSC